MEPNGGLRPAVGWATVFTDLPRLIANAQNSGLCTKIR